jgi:hypothetical protein
MGSLFSTTSGTGIASVNREFAEDLTILESLI